MALRFFDTNFYKSPFVRGLQGACKGLYSFIICDCKASGIWAKDLEVASLYIGFKITEKDFDVFLKIKRSFCNSSERTIDTLQSDCLDLRFPRLVLVLCP